VALSSSSCALSLWFSAAGWAASSLALARDALSWAIVELSFAIVLGSSGILKTLFVHGSRYQAAGMRGQG
jgi:hypothetical protein